MRLDIGGANHAEALSSAKAKIRLAASPSRLLNYMNRAEDKASKLPGNLDRNNNVQPHRKTHSRVTIGLDTIF
jgi:hypothetical protein